MTGSRIRVRIGAGGGSAYLLAIAVALSVGLSACFSSGHPAAHPPPTTTTTRVRSTTTVPGVQTSGARTVLSPIGLNLRAQPSLSATVLGTAAEGVKLQVLGHTAVGGGWFEVKGTTVTGWITANARLSAPGTFTAYNSSAHQFAALYPQSWTVTESAANAIFRASPRGGETIVVSTAPTVAKVGRGRAGYREVASEQTVTCGITANLDIYVQATAPPSTVTAPPAGASERYLAQILLTLDLKHALVIDANLTALSQLQTVRDFANSVSFPFPECEG